MTTHPKARIYQPARNAMQSGKGKTRQWLLEFEPPAPGTPDALMGWNSMPDTITEVRLKFDTKEEAIAYATAKQIPFELFEPHHAVVVPKAYAENFSFKNAMRGIVRVRIVALCYHSRAVGIWRFVANRISPLP